MGEHYTTARVSPMPGKHNNNNGNNSHSSTPPPPFLE